MLVFSIVRLKVVFLFLLRLLRNYKSEEDRQANFTVVILSGAFLETVSKSHLSPFAIATEICRPLHIGHKMPAHVTLL